MRAADFDLLSRVLHERSGLALTPEKTYLLESRLMPVARRLGVANTEALVALVRQGSDPAVLRAVTEAMTTNETQFFRDKKPFEQFRRTVLPRLLANRTARRSIRIWCAASSSGQEPYSLAMLCREEQPNLAGWKIDIVATDLSREMVERAREGLYGQFEVQRGLPIQYLARYFNQVADRWQLKPEIRDAVHFREFNLLDDPRPLGSFDIVFCRNVLIYFDLPTKAKVLRRIAERLAPDGALFLGGSETVLGVSDQFEQWSDESGVYRRVVAAAPRLAVA